MVVPNKVADSNKEEFYLVVSNYTSLFPYLNIVIELAVAASIIFASMTVFGAVEKKAKKVVKMLEEDEKNQLEMEATPDDDDEENEDLEIQDEEKSE